MIKTFTPYNDPSQLPGSDKCHDLIPGTEKVKMLMNYSKALQVLRCNDFATYYIVLN